MFSRINKNIKSAMPSAINLCTTNRQLRSTERVLTKAEVYQEEAERKAMMLRIFYYIIHSIKYMAETIATGPSTRARDVRLGTSGHYPVCGSADLIVGCLRQFDLSYYRNR